MKKNLLILTKVALLVFLSAFLVSCSSDKRISVPCYEWKICFGDNMAYADPDYDDSAWEWASVDKDINMPKGEHFFWLRKTIEIPPELNGSNLWMGVQKVNASSQFYADGIYLSGKGTFPPDRINLKIEENDDILVPSNFIKNGKVNIAVRMYVPGTFAHNLCLSLDNDAQGFFINRYKNIFNQRIFLCIATLCAFIMFYSLLQFFMDKKNKTFLYFAACLLFIVLYFYDMGSELTILPYNIQRAFARACLPVSMAFLMLFLNRFYNRKKFKFCLTLAIIVSIAFTVTYIFAVGNDTMIDNVFLASMVPTVAVIVYGFVVTIHGVRTKVYDSIPVLIGFITGSCCAIHDVVCQVLGIVPFMWTQGFAFFLVDLSVFITLAIRESTIKKEIQRISQETHELGLNLFEETQTLVVAAKENAATSQDQSAAVKEIVATMEDSNALSENISSKIRDVSKVAEKTSSDVAEGVASIEHNVSQLHAIFDANQQTIEGMKVLSERIESIWDIVTLINNVADQAKIIAFNAELEASSAGEAGKSFRIVANEIRRLSDGIIDGTKEIKERINEIQHSSDALILASESGTEKINEGYENAKSLGEKFASIRNSAEVTADSAGDITDIIQQQTSASEQILIALKQISAGVENFTVATDNISRSSEHIRTMSEQMNDRYKDADSEEMVKHS